MRRRIYSREDPLGRIPRPERLLIRRSREQKTQNLRPLNRDNPLIHSKFICIVLFRLCSDLKAIVISALRLISSVFAPPMVRESNPKTFLFVRLLTTRSKHLMEMLTLK